ncbi:2a69: auxin efflux carrier [Tepidimonas alkaliphilus]|uniref:2a69: auxin efflux carrier n=1 Tax=Tepidimonas alkaliphilus TaxID=2588942 RepID=A0A554W4B2_9BURK|nr:2a69: auxin efflux carrier [Tepidimonas alkaliphilus]
MELGAILLVTLPFFALVAAGYVATRRGWLPLAAIPGLNGFVLFFALPAMLYRFSASTPIAQLLDAAVAGTWLLAGLLLVALTMAATRSGRIGWNDAAFGALVTAFPNTGFMGVPLIAALLGPQAVGTVIVVIVVDMVVTTSLCLALSRLDAGEGGARAALKQALAGVLRNPMPWAIGAGALASAWSFALPAPLDKTVALLADAASPVALFTIGAVLARSQLQADHPTRWRDDVPLALAKLLLHPLLVLLLGAALAQLGAPLTAPTLTALVVAAALPSASNVSLLAERMGADNGRIARIILISTALAFVTFAAVVAWVRPG